MTKKRKQLKQIQNQAQQGRSMVEMLGVLAIIGVLSIGGIAGYRWGMDKHVANQILNEMNLNSAQLAMLLQKGNEDGVTLSLGSPYDDENPTFSTVNYGFDYGCGKGTADEIEFHKCLYIDETRYYIEAYNLPERVAKMVADSAAGLQYYDGYDEAESQNGENQKDVTVFFDVDPDVTEHETRPAEPETPTPTPEVTEPTTTTTTTEATTPETTTTEPATTTEATTTTTQQTNCPDEAPWSDTADDCVCTDTTQHWNGAACVSCEGGTWENGKCICPESKVLWSSKGKCVDNVCNNGTGCTDDAEGNPQYCDMDNGSLSCSDGVPSASGGTCTSVTDNSYSEVTVTNGTGDKKTIYVSKSSVLDWWAADAFCQALGRKLSKPIHLVSVGDLGCSTSSRSCPTGSYGKSLIDQLKIDNWGWTSTLYYSCLAYRVNLTDGRVYSNYRYGYYRYALCGPEE